ncbi:hypothetical protein EON64_16155, partial [archaeon]
MNNNQHYYHGNKQGGGHGGSYEQYDQRAPPMRQGMGMGDGHQRPGPANHMDNRGERRPHHPNHHDAPPTHHPALYGD